MNDFMATHVEDLQQENAALRREIEYLKGNMDLCIEYLDLLKTAMQGQTKYTCGLCGAGPEDDHKDTCPLEISRNQLLSVASSAALRNSQ